MDIVDIAQDTERLLFRAALSSTLQAGDSTPPCGRCYNCDAYVSPGARFCDADCRDDHQRRDRQSIIAGRNP